MQTFVYIKNVCIGTILAGKFKVWRNASLEGAENVGYLSVLRPARQSSAYGAPPPPEENCYVETPCTRSCGDGFKAEEEK
jgi:hypothetical protein